MIVVNKFQRANEENGRNLCHSLCIKARGDATYYSCKFRFFRIRIFKSTITQKVIMMVCTVLKWIQSEHPIFSYRWMAKCENRVEKSHLTSLLVVL